MVEYFDYESVKKMFQKRLKIYTISARKSFVKKPLSLT